MVLYIMANMRMGRNMDKENSIGVTIQCIKANSSIIIYTERVCMYEAMAENMKANGSLTKWMAKVYLHGWMEGST